MIFDAPDHTVAPLLDEAKRRGWDVIGLWLTHGHFDHVADHALVTERFPDARVLIHRLDEPKLLRPNSSFFRLPFAIPPRRADGYLDDGQELQIGSLPGAGDPHARPRPRARDVLPARRAAAGRRRLDHHGCGRPDRLPRQRPGRAGRVHPQGDAPARPTRLLPGHGQPSTLDQERAENPFVREALEGQG